MPSVDDVLALLRPLPELDRKVVGGMVACMMAQPGQVRDREWVARNFLQVAVVAHGFPDDGSAATTADVDLVQRYAQQRMRPILDAAMAMFVRVAEDLRARPAPTMDEARAAVAGYLAR